MHQKMKELSQPISNKSYIKAFISTLMTISFCNSWRILNQPTEMACAISKMMVLKHKMVKLQKSKRLRKREKSFIQQTNLKCVCSASTIIMWCVSTTIMIKVLAVQLRMPARRSMFAPTWCHKSLSVSNTGHVQINSKSAEVLPT